MEASYKEGLEEKKYRQCSPVASAPSFVAPNNNCALHCRYFRFTVSKPLSITTKMNIIGDAIILRNTIVNESGCPFFFEKMSFVPQAPYACTDLNYM